MVAEILKLLRERLIASDKSILHVHVYKCQCTLLTKSLLYFLLLRFIVAYDFLVFGIVAVAMNLNRACFYLNYLGLYVRDKLIFGHFPRRKPFPKQL